PQHITEDAYIIDNYGEDEYQIGDRLPIPLIPDYMDDIAAPTISQVLNWLFDKKQLFVNIDCNICDKFGLFFTIYKKGEETWEACGFDDNYYNKPEEATLAGIEYVLDNLI
ncbi:MAG: hypothetical protein II304_09825, partial [Bacteroidales bacterium]|nr:hypothetical protein [Bacteroidales bacterium]